LLMLLCMFVNRGMSKDCTKKHEQEKLKASRIFFPVSLCLDILSFHVWDSFSFPKRLGVFKWPSDCPLEEIKWCFRVFSLRLSRSIVHWVLLVMLEFSQNKSWDLESQWNVHDVIRNLALNCHLSPPLLGFVPVKV
jgi:hypothetical protein